MTSPNDKNQTEKTPAVILLSGGLDSATVLAIADEQGFALNAISFDYGQRHSFELNAARQVAATHAVAQHIIFPLDLRTFGGSALTDDVAVPKNRDDDEISTGIPITYVPARNTIFLSVALAWAETLGAKDIFIGVNAVDYSGYPDCRPAFITAFTDLANLATKAGVESDVTDSYQIHTPLIDLTKAEIIQRGITLGVDYSLTHSCYDPSSTGSPCQHCDSCRLRQAGFQTAGLTDPLLSSK